MNDKNETIETKEVGELTGKNIIVYDLEIVKRIEDCTNGWNSHDEMGISVGCAFDYADMKFRVFMDDNIMDLVNRMNEPSTVIVAFNHISFDNKLLRASGLPLKPDEELNNYDMLLISKAGCDLGPTDYIGGFKLDHHLRALGLPMKTANGAMAPIWWQQGKIGAVTDYCMNDVTQEKALFEYMWRTGTAASQYNPKNYAIKRPEFSPEDGGGCLF